MIPQKMLLDETCDYLAANAPRLLRAACWLPVGLFAALGVFNLACAALVAGPPWLALGNAAAAAVCTAAAYFALPR